jgi:AraC-like DNA-binding protein
MGAYREIGPSARLAAFIECYWFSDGGTQRREHLVLPDGCVDLLFSSGQRGPLDLSVVGLMTAPARIEIPAGSSYFGVRFRPAMASLFIPDAAGLRDGVVPLEALWGARGRVVLDQLTEAAEATSQVEIMEKSLSPSGSLGAALELQGQSDRSFRRKCVERSGVSPKLLQRILRFRAATRRIYSELAGGAVPIWGQFALECGYYDQAHLIREFREFAGCSPGRFVQSLRVEEAVESVPYEPGESEFSD